MKTEQNYFTSSGWIIGIFITISAASPSRFLGQEYYYSNGQQVDLTTDYSEIIVFFNQEVDLDSIIMSHENLLAIEKNIPYNAVIAHFSASLSANFSVTQLGLDLSSVKCHAFGKITEDGTPIFLTNKVVIEGRMNTNYGEILESNINLFDGQFERIEHSYCIFSFASTEIALNFANAMYESHTVNYSIPDIFARIRAWDDPLYSSQLQVFDQPTIMGTDGPMDIDVDADEVWPMQMGNSDVIVAVFDDGLEAHEDFNTDNLMSGFNTNALFYEYPENSPAWFFDGSCVVSSYHGLPVAGIIAAQHNDIGSRGIAPGVKLLPVRELFNVFTTLQGQAAAFYQLAEQNADVINCSWGFDNCEFNWQPPDDAIAYAANYGRNGLGCVIVFSSGNAALDCVTYPANLPQVIAVGALSSDGDISGYSCIGPELDIVAPSSATLNVGQVTTLDRMGAAGYNSSNYMDNFGGTSASAPSVSGAAALLISEQPDLTASQIRELLCSNADDLGADGWDATYGFGNLNIKRAFDALLTDPCADAQSYDFLQKNRAIRRGFYNCHQHEF